MPVVSVERLRSFTETAFRVVGVPPDVAEIVAASLAASNLVGHDSHGVIRIPSYLQALEKGAIVPGARPSIRRETATTAVIDGHWGFGQLAAQQAMGLALAKARSGVGAVAICRCNHVGRLGEYTESAAAQGMVGIMMCSELTSGVVTPYGGVERLLGTNPIAISVPSVVGDPLTADFATSATAVGKLAMARALGQAIAPETIVDKAGNPTTNVEDFYAGGMLLPFGGYKGYALAVVIDLLAGYLGEGELFLRKASATGVFVIAVDVGAFRPVAEFQESVARRLERIKAARPAPGVETVMLPGEPERRKRAQRQERGVDLPEDVWRRLNEIADRMGLERLAGS